MVLWAVLQPLVIPCGQQYGALAQEFVAVEVGTAAVVAPDLANKPSNPPASSERL